METRPKKVFISYSHEDLYYREQAQKYLVNLDKQGLIEIWHDKAIEPGKKWDDEIKTKLNEADIVIILVSQDFIASAYSQKTEMSLALGNVASGKTTIIPFLIDYCDWNDWEVIPLTKTEDDLNNDAGKMGNYQFMPLHDENQRLFPLTDKKQWPNESLAWMKLTKYIRSLVSKQH